MTNPPSDDKVDVYPVGVLRDLRSIRHVHRRKGLREALRRLRYVLRSKSWTRRSAWNGYLAEAPGMPRAGHGWTYKRAMRSLDRAAATLHYARHSCGKVRLACDETRFCPRCKTRDRDWTRLDVDPFDPTTQESR